MVPKKTIKIEYFKENEFPNNYRQKSTLIPTSTHRYLAFEDLPLNISEAAILLCHLLLVTTQISNKLFARLNK